ncbi:MAG TPA: FAD-linked oxidase C-terminal domain-containing protein [Thermaerobacter sp.]
MGEHGDRGAFLAALRRIYPSGAIHTDPAQLAAYECDGLTVFRSRPLAVVLPTRREQVEATVRLCREHGVPFVARGSGTSLSGGAVPVPGGIVIALNRMNRILHLDPGDRLAVVEPGVVNLQISRAAAPYGLYYAPDPSSQVICTIGGNVSFNSGGAHCLKYGMTANHVLGMKVVLATGETVSLGGTSLDVAGPDLPGLFTGAEGQFGVVVEVTVRLLPRPEAVRTVLAAYRRLDQAGDAVSAVVGAGLLPAAMEIMDRLAMDAAEAAVGAGYPRQAGALLIVELDGPADEVEADFRRLMAVIEASGPTEIRLARDEADRQRLWKGRKSAFSAVGHISLGYLVQDGVVPRTRLGEALARIEELAARHGFRVANVFHAGDGNLHPLILFDDRSPETVQRAEELAAAIIETCIELGGSITGEHGVGLEKRRFLPRMFDPVTLDLMRSIRRTFDPQELANRGKVFPDEPAPPGPGDPGVRCLATAAAAGTAKATPAGVSQAPGHPPGYPSTGSGTTAAPAGDAGDVPVLRPQGVEELAALVREASRVIPRGGGTKAGSGPAGGGWVPGARGAGAQGAVGGSGDGPGTLRVRGDGGADSDPPEGLPAGTLVVDTTGLAGIVDYDPAEFTVTVRAGTRVAELEAVLARHGQYLPFDPLLVDAGATLGGTVAMGVSGPCRLRYGGVRDFVLGVTLVDGRGRVVRGGGRVVKNAAGYDLPKFLCGSMGRFGVLAELTFKVFPRPEAWGTVALAFAGIQEAAAALAAVYRSPLEPHALELAAPGVLDHLPAAAGAERSGAGPAARPGGGPGAWSGAGPGYVLLVRVAGPAAILPAWLDRVRAAVPGAGRAEILTGPEEEALWRGLRELAWTRSAQGGLLRLYGRPARLLALDDLWRRHGGTVLYTQAATGAWVLFPDPVEPARRDGLRAVLAEQGIPALVWSGDGWGGPPPAFLVPPEGTAVAQALKAVFDPGGRFPALPWWEAVREPSPAGIAGAGGA